MEQQPQKRSRVKQKLFRAGFCLPSAQKINSTLVLAVNSIVNPQKNASVYNKHVFYGFFRTCIKTIRIYTYRYFWTARWCTYICVFLAFVYTILIHIHRRVRVSVLCLRNQTTICLQVFTIFLVNTMCVVCVWGFACTHIGTYSKPALVYSHLLELEYIKYRVETYYSRFECYISCKTQTALTYFLQVIGIMYLRFCNFFCSA